MSQRLRWRGQSGPSCPISSPRNRRRLSVAVDYFHYLVVTGPHAAVGNFAHRIALVVNRRVGGATVQQTVPFSFESLYVMAGIKGDVPGDPYDMTRWPIVRRGKVGEVRFRFHTRSLELHPLLKRLSKATPQLTFALVTNCLDDGDFAPFRIQKGKLRGKWLGGDWRMPFWERAAEKYKMSLEELYDDDLIGSFAESWMRDAALHIATGTDRKYEWGGGRVYPDLFNERATYMMELAQALKTAEAEEKQKRPPSTRRKKNR